MLTEVLKYCIEPGVGDEVEFFDPDLQTDCMGRIIEVTDPYSFLKKGYCLDNGGVRHCVDADCIKKILKRGRSFEEKITELNIDASVEWFSQTVADLKEYLKKVEEFEVEAYRELLEWLQSKFFSYYDPNYDSGVEDCRLCIYWDGGDADVGVNEGCTHPILYDWNDGGSLNSSKEAMMEDCFNNSKHCLLAQKKERVKAKRR